MTSEELRKIDAKIAEHVMGWNLEDIAIRINRFEVFHPSTNIAAAWEVVEKMREDLFFFALQNLTIQTTLNNKNIAVFIPDGPSRNLKFVADAETMPLAVCLASLKAKGVKP